VGATGEDLKVGLAGGELEHVTGRSAPLQGEGKGEGEGGGGGEGEGEGEGGGGGGHGEVQVCKCASDKSGSDSRHGG
jgi:hypothetical protein